MNLPEIKLTQKGRIWEVTLRVRWSPVGKVQTHRWRFVCESEALARVQALRVGFRLGGAA